MSNLIIIMGATPQNISLYVDMCSKCHISSLLMLVLYITYLLSVMDLRQVLRDNSGNTYFKTSLLHVTCTYY